MNKKVLIVEDEGIVALQIEDTLKSLGYEVSGIASSGEGAIEKAGNTHPDIVLMDIVIKGEMDGIEAADHIRNNFNIPVIFLTAYDDEGTLNRAKITEPFGYLLKPLRERDLHIAIEMAIYKHTIESRLKAIDRFLSTILKSIGDAVITTDTRGIITFSNSVAGILTGWDMEDAINKNFTDIFNIVNERTHKPFENPVISIVRDGNDLNLDPDTILLARNGKEIPIDGKGATLNNEKGSIEGMVFIFRDITERKRMGRELAESEERYRRLFETSKDGILLLHKQTGQIINVNPAVMAMLGYTHDEFMGKKLMDVGLLKDMGDHQEIMQRLEVMGFIHYDYMPVKNKNGEVVDTEVYLTDRTRVIQCNVRDITQRKKTEEELKKHREHLEELVKERTAQLNQKNEELERFNRIFVGRELRMIELKKKIAELEKSSGDKKSESNDKS